MNTIISFSVPSNSEAASILQGFSHGERSEFIRACIERSARLEALERQRLAFAWMLRERGVCPATMCPDETTPKVHQHDCAECRWASRKVFASKKDAEFKQSVLEGLQAVWREHWRWVGSE